jgi:hypothetical protein
LRTVSHSDLKDAAEFSLSELSNTGYILLGTADGCSRNAIQLDEIKEHLSLRKA